MTTWKQCIKFYEDVFDILHEYGVTRLKDVKPDSELTAISLLILEKLHINLINCIDLLRATDEQPAKFLSLGLIMRGILSDIINYRYLRKVYEILGAEDFENELMALDLEFVKAYKKIVENEKKIANGDVEVAKKIDKTFQKTFEAFHNGNVLKRRSDFKSKEFSNKLHEYLATIGVETTLPIHTESGKIRFVQDNHTERVDLLYTYLSQLQHFSGRAYNFYKTKEYSVFNPHLTALLIFLVAVVTISIISDLDADRDAMAALILVAQQIAQL